MNTSKKEQTIIERVTNDCNHGCQQIPNSQMNVWKDIKTGEIADLDYFLTQGWQITNISTSNSACWSPGGNMYHVTHSQLLLEK